MVSYPQLSATQQHSLPALVKPAVTIPAKFEDSTHQLWHCDTVDGPMVLKVCQQQSIEQSVFWQGMNKLFEADFPNSLGQIAFTHDYLAEYGQCVIPPYIASDKSSFVLSRYLDGQDVSEAAITDDLVMKLAEHLAACHQQNYERWGCLHQPTLTVDDWPTRLQRTLQDLAALSAHTIAEEILQQAMAQAATIQTTYFVPIMPDLRWDQLRLLSDGQLAIIDMDAFVIGPRELELVLLEYLLTAEQMTLFAEVYQSYLPLPALSNCRLSYRLLLFLMNVLGETDINAWLQYQPAKRCSNKG